MVDLYLMSKTDSGLWLKESLAGSLPGLRVEGAALEGLASQEGQRFRQDMATRKRARSGIGPCWIMTGCFGGIRDRSKILPRIRSAGAVSGSGCRRRRYPGRRP